MEPLQETETTKWWQSDLGRAGIFSLIFIVAIILLYQVKWSGLRGKNIWDWMDLIIVPLVLAGGGLFLQRIEERRIKREEALEKEREERQAEREKQQARDNLMDGIFQSYLDDMSDLMINHQLQTNLEIVTAHWEQEKQVANIIIKSESAGEEPSDKPLGANTVEAARLAEATAVVTVARARTVTALRSLDVTRRNLLSNFLRETGLVVGERGTLLTEVDLSGMDLSETSLHNFNFTGCMFYKTNFSQSVLNYAELKQAELMEANLSKAWLYETNLSEAMLSNANLSEALFFRSNLSKATLNRANLRGANLDCIKLVEADLYDTQFDETTILPEGGTIMDVTDDGKSIYAKYWSKDTDMTRYTNPNHPDFWEEKLSGSGGGSDLGLDDELVLPDNEDDIA